MEAIAGALIGGVFVAAVNWLLLRRARRAAADFDFAQTAQVAWRRTLTLERRLKTHDRRWRLLMPVVDRCAEEVPELSAKIAEIREINDLTDIDAELDG